MDEPTKLDASAVRLLIGKLLAGQTDIEFIPNPGNAGDALINAGAWQLFEQVGVPAFIHLPASTHASSQVYVYPGGGNLVPLYSNGSDAISKRLDRPFNTFIVLPHTIRGHEALLGRLDERFHVFCRDRLSWAHVRAWAPRVHCYLADDLALALDLDWVFSPWRNALRFARLARSPRALKRYLLWRRSIAAILPVQGTLRLMRVDEEARTTVAADPRMDLSAQYGSLFTARGEAELVTRDFLAVLQRAERIESDRLHVGIGASLLGKDVRLLDNSYGKNKGIYEFSMRERFPHTCFVE
jgi:exopolysaccharide biosynthesis predicted pyruvyltransferase EpsI